MARSSGSRVNTSSYHVGNSNLTWYHFIGGRSSPVWWNNFPTILRGWVERVLSYGFAYSLTEKGLQGDIEGRVPILKLKKAPIINTFGVTILAIFQSEQRYYLVPSVLSYKPLSAGLGNKTPLRRVLTIWKTKIGRQLVLQKQGKGLSMKRILASKLRGEAFPKSQSRCSPRG